MIKEVLVIEDNREIKVLLDFSLEDYKVCFCENLAEATKALSKQKFDLILLDLGLPDGDGLQFLTHLSSSPETKDTPVIILSGKSEISNKVLAFSVGAEDFISKPFDPLELKARVAAKLKRSEKNQSKSEALKVGDLSFQVPKQRVAIVTDGKEETIDLTSLEFRLLLTLAKAPERIFSRDFLLSEVWGSDVSVTDRTVDTHIGHVRKKISKSKCKIDTVIGSGYRFLV